MVKPNREGFFAVGILCKVIMMTDSSVINYSYDENNDILNVRWIREEEKSNRVCKTTGYDIPVQPLYGRRRFIH